MTDFWEDECRGLRAQGLSQPEIAARLGKTKWAVSKVLNETKAQKRAMKRMRERNWPCRLNRGKPEFPTSRAARAAPPPKITPEIKQAAILAFAKHEIDRLELMKRITPREKWSKAGLL